MRKFKIKNILKAIKISSVFLVVFTVFLTSVGLMSANEMDIPVAISSEEEFYDRISNNLSGYFVIKNQITFSKPIKPIGDKDHPFKGMISGSGLNVNGVEIDINAFDSNYILDKKLYIGLFPFNEGIIKDVNFSEVKFVNFNNNLISDKYDEIICGSVCGSNKGKITKCCISGYNIPININCGDFIFGSITGINYGEMRLCAMPQNINISGKASNIIIGGLTGISDEGYLDKCLRKGWILTNNLECSSVTIGCLCGKSINSKFENCCVYNNYDDNVGLNEDANTTFILGGFVGMVSNGSSILNSYSNLTIAVKNSPSVKCGFFFGYSSSNIAISNCVVNGTINVYSSGDILTSDAGIFSTESNVDFWNCYRLEKASLFPLPVENYLVFSKIDSKDLSLKMLGWDSNVWNIKNGVISFVV